MKLNSLISSTSSFEFVGELFKSRTSYQIYATSWSSLAMVTILPWLGFNNLHRILHIQEPDF